MTKRISLVLGFALAFASAMFAHAADSGLTANTPNWVAINTGQASGDESPSLSSAADYTAYFCTVETAKQLFGGAATVEAITGYLSDHYETGKTALRTSGKQLNTSSYDLGQYSFVKYFETAPAVADYLGIIFYDGDDGSEFRVFGSDNAKRDDHWVVFDDNTSGVGEWVKLTDMAVSVTDWKGTYDSESHSAMVMVTEPAMGYTITWDDTSTGATGPAYTDAGSYTNVFTVTADGYFDFVGTGVVEIAEAPVVAYSAEIFTEKASSDTSPSLTSAADYTAYFCTAEVAEALFGSSDVAAIAAYLSENYDAGKAALGEKGTLLDATEYKYGQYTFIKYFPTALATAQYLGIIFYDNGTDTEFRIFGSDNAERGDNYVSFDDEESGTVTDWTKPTTPEPPAGSVTAIGADETLTIGDETVYVFSTVGTEGKSITVSGSVTAQILVVGGGGAGGGHAGSGGGAGGLIHTQDVALASGTYVITVGAGGASVKGQFQGNNGNNSSFGDLIALGGGGGGGCYTLHGSAGGSGGGAGRNGGTTGTAGAGNQPTSASGGLGNAGGRPTSNWYTAGGGGAGGAGSASTSTAGKVAGGAGYECAIVGTNAWYAGGGGGCKTTTCAYSAGANGGGNGGNDSNGTNATTPGSGGGGAGFKSQVPAAYSSGAGANGIVIVRVKGGEEPPTPPEPPADGVTVETDDGRISVVVKPGVVEEDEFVYLAWDTEDKGVTMSAWANKRQIATVTSAGGTFTVDSASLGVFTGNRIRAFIVNGEEVSLYAAITKPKSVAGLIRTGYIPGKTRKTSGVDIDLKFTGTSIVKDGVASFYGVADSSPEALLEANGSATRTTATSEAFSSNFGNGDATSIFNWVHGYNHVSYNGKTYPFAAGTVTDAIRQSRNTIKLRTGANPTYGSLTSATAWPAAPTWDFDVDFAVFGQHKRENDRTESLKPLDVIDMTLYGFRVYEKPVSAHECVANYIPAEKDGVKGLYETMTATFHPATAEGFTFEGSVTNTVTIGGGGGESIASDAVIFDMGEDSTIQVVGEDASYAIGDDMVYVFSTVGAEGKRVTVSGAVAAAQILVVGGGGAGASDVGGGGGGGGVVYLQNQMLSVGTYSIVVGAGGAAPTTSNDGAGAGNDGGNGGNSSFGDWIGLGGGGGGGWSNRSGKAGGCGGGGSMSGAIGATTQELYDGAGHGTAAGKPSGKVGGGGGGAGTSGSGATGGNGFLCKITGEDVYYGAGGGGGAGSGGTRGLGGQGGGGNGSDYSTGGARTEASGYGAGGGGGNGTTGTDVNTLGGKGYQGIVIVRVANPTVVQATIENYQRMADGHAHAATVTVTYPTEGYTIRWAEVSDHPDYSITEPPAYSEVGVYTNLVRVTAPNLDPFYGECVVEICENIPVVVTGADKRYFIDSDTVYVFSTVGSEGKSIVVPSMVAADILVVAGGGGGGGTTAGGGGAGGLIYQQEVELAEGTYTITVGAGGAASNGQTQGGNGGNSSFGELIAIGGGGGGGWGNSARTGKSGGSGGGGCAAGAAGTGTAGQGHNGGKSYGSELTAGGGGGAGSAGPTPASKQRGAGGDGLEIDITGEPVWYAGGGGGGGSNSSTAGIIIGGGAAGGKGGGGNGGYFNATGSFAGENGIDGTGGGGGGGGWNGGNVNGGKGGSGIVIVRVHQCPTAVEATIENYHGFAYGPAYAATVTVTYPTEGYEIRWAEVSDHPVYSITEPPVYSEVGAYTNLVQITAPGLDPFYGKCVVELREPLRVVVDDSTGSDETGDGSEEKPLKTIAKGIDAAKSGLATGIFEKGMVLVRAGTYAEHSLVLDDAIEIVGMGATREDVIIDAQAQGQVFKLNHVAALIENVTIENGYLNGNGANVSITLGTVRNCDILNGATAGLNLGANVYMINGRLANCRVIGGIVCKGGHTSGGTAYGAGVYASGNAVVENCFIKGNYYNKTNGNTYSTDIIGTAAVAAEYSRFVNCTFVANHGPSRGGKPMHVASANARVVNCVFFQNQLASVTENLVEHEYGSSNPSCFINCAAAVPAPSGSTGCLTGLTAVDFADSVNGDYRPVGMLVDAGCSEGDYFNYGATSTTDLAGAARVRGSVSVGERWLDIGAYERQSDGLDVMPIPRSYSVGVGLDAIFSVQVFRAEGEVSYYWDFGDGTTSDWTTETTVTHAFKRQGTFAVTVKAKTATQGETDPVALARGPIYVGPSDLYVDAEQGDDETGDGTSVKPLKTIAAAVKKTLLGSGDRITDVTIHLADSETAYAAPFVTLDWPVTILGNPEHPENVIVDANKASGIVFTLSHAEAVVRGLTVKNANYNSDRVVSTAISNGSFRLNDGLVADCIVQNIVYHTNSHGAGAYITGGRMTRCVFKGCQYYGSTIYASVVTMTGGVLENCLFVGNKMITLNAGNRPGLIAFAGSATVVNCTIVANQQMNYPFYVYSGTPTVANTVMYKNNGTSPNIVSEWAGFNSGTAIRFFNCAANGALPSSASGSDNLTELDDSAFVDYASGDYRPAKGGKLVDAGNDSLYAANAVSETDLALNPRPVGPIDIGAYEFQPTEFTLQVETSAGVIDPAESSVIKGTVFAAPGAVTWTWSVNGGEFIPGTATYMFTGFTDGVYTVTAKATAGGESREVATVVRVVSAGAPVEEVWVDGAAGDNARGAGVAESPFATITYAKEFLDAHPAEGVQTIHVADGLYVAPFMTLDRPLEIVGNPEHPENVIIDAASVVGTVFFLNHADAVVRGLTVNRAKGGATTSGSPLTWWGGGSFRVDDGAVEDCIIQNTVYQSNNHGAGACIRGGRVTRCVFKNCRYYGSTGCASAVTMLGGVLENCLFTGNPLDQNNASNRPGLIAFQGNATVVNCTIVNSGKMNMPFYVNSGAATIVNTVMYKNNGDSPNVVSEWASVASSASITFVNCAANGALPTSSTVSGSGNLTELDDRAFVNYAGGDYRPAAGGALVDAGNQALYAANATSETDLALNPRQVGPIDLGAYEFQPTEFTLQVTASAGVIDPAESLVVKGTVFAAPGAVTWTWKVDGGEFISGTATYVFTGLAEGVHTITAKATAGGESREASTVVRVVSAGALVEEVWVDSMVGDDVTGAGVESSPFATIAHAKEFLATYGAAGTIHVMPGAYYEYNLVLDGAYIVQGEGESRDDVIVNAGKLGRAFTLSADGAALRNLTIQNGRITTGSATIGGANIYMTANGEISNCVIKNGVAFYLDSRGGNVFMTNGSLTDCLLLGGSGNNNNSCIGTSIYATGGHLSRCEIRNATYTYMGSIVVDLEGAVTFENSLITGCKAGTNAGYSPCVLKVNNAGARVVNCTVVGNTSSKFGVRANNAGAKIINCVIFDNGGTADLEWGSANAACFSYCAFASGLAPAAGTACSDMMTPAAFTKYDKETGEFDFTPQTGDVLDGKGSNDLYTDDLSRTDLAGNPRFVESKIDIGAYEGLSTKVMATLTGYEGYEDGEGHTATLEIGYPLKGATVKWWNGEDYVFDEAPVYEEAGEYVVKVRVSADGLTPFEGEAQVVLFEAATIDATLAAVTVTYDQDPHGAVLTVVEPADVTVLWWNDATEQFDLAEQPTFTVAGVHETKVRLTKYSYMPLVLSATVTIDQAPVTVTWGSTHLDYTGVEQTPVVTLVGILEGDEAEPVVTGAIKGPDQSGTAKVTGLTGEDAANYTLTGDNLETEFTIAEYAGVILALDLSEATYAGGVIDPGVRISGAGEIVTPEMCVFAWTNLETGVGVDAPSAAGTYELTVSRKDGYEGKSVSATFVIHHKDAQLVWGETVFPYTGETQVPTVELQGLIPGDDVTLAVTGAARLPGAYTAKVALDGAALPNYNISGLTQVAFEIESPDILLTAENGLITVKVLADVVPVKTPLILTWDDADQGDEPDAWTHQAKLGDVTAAGDTFRTNGFALAIENGAKIKAFLVQDIDFYESLTKSQTATGVVVLDYIPQKSKNTSGIDVSAKFAGTYQSAEAFFCGVSDISSGVQQWIRVMSGGTASPYYGVQMWMEEQYYSASHTKWGANDPNRLKDMKDFVGRTGTKPTWGGTASDGSNAWAADINYDYVDPLSVFGRIVRTATSVTTNSYAMWDITIGRVSIYEKPGSAHVLVANYVPAKIGGDFGFYNTINDNFCAATSNDGFSYEKAATNSLHGTIAMSLVEVYAIDTTKVSAVVEDCEVIYDGEQHANTLWVMNPQTGWTATWRNAAGAVLPDQPSYIETGVFTNFVEVTADTLTPFVGTGVVTIAKINLETDVTVDPMLPFLATGNPIHPTPAVRYKQTGNVVAMSDLSFEYLGGDCIEPGEYTIRITGKAGRNHAEGMVEIPFTIFNGKYYVATDGSDETGDGSKDNPFATIARGLVAARVGYNEYAGSGDFRPTVVVAPGTYAEKYILLDFPVVIQGLGEARGANAEDGVYVNCKTANDEFIFKLDHESAALENIRIHCSSHDYNTCGYNLYLVKGTVRYCNVTGGTLNQKNAYMTGGRMEDTWISGGNRVNSENPGDAINLYMSGGTAARLKITGGIGGNSVHLYNSALLSDSLITDFSRYNHKSYSSGNKVGHAVIAEGSSVVLNCSIVNNKSVTGTSYEARSAVRLVGSSKAINCVIYGNLDSAGADSAFLEWDDGSVAANFVNCAFGEGLAPAAGTACVDGVTDVDFTDYVAGDYTPLARGLLENAGNTALYREYLPKENLDLAGKQRVSNNFIDIGCYEQASWSVEATLTGGAYSHDGRPHAAVLAITYPEAGAYCSTNWTWSDGTDGHPLPEDCTEIGIYTNSVVVSSTFVTETGGTLDPFTATAVVKILDFDGTNYVAKTGSDDGDGTQENPYRTLARAVAMSRHLFEEEDYRQTVTIVLAEGEYSDSGLVVNWPIRIRGDITDPSRVVINDSTSGQCAFTLAHPDARVEGLTITGQGRRGGTGSQGGHVLMTDGTVADCVIANGIAMQNNTGSGYGGNVYMEGGSLLRCVITNGMITLSGTATTQQGGNVYAAGGLVANCLIAGGQSVSTKKSSDSAVGVQGVGLYLAGTAKAVNCTIANNSATLADSPAGVYVADASAQVINCVIYNNRAADKDTAVTEWGCVQADSYTCCAVIDPAEIVGGVDNRADLTSTNFVDAVGGDFHFVAGSILQDIGSLARYRELMAEFPELDLDLDRHPRICRMFTGSPERIDVGAYERSTVDRINATFTGVDVPYDGQSHWAFLSIHAPAGGAYCTTTWTWSDGTEHVDAAEICTKPGQYVNRVVVRADASLQLPLFRGVVTNIIRDVDLTTGVVFDPDPLPIYEWTGEVIHPEPKVILTASGVELSREDYTYEYVGDCTSPGWHTVRVVPHNQFVTGEYEAEFFIFDGKCYVRTTGSDETGDGTEAKPFATIAKALEFAREMLTHDDLPSTTVLVGPGIYAEYGLVMDFPVKLQGLGDAKTDDAGAYIRYNTLDGKTILTVKHEDAVVENMRVSRVSKTYNNSGLNLNVVLGTVRKCWISGAGEAGDNVQLSGGRLEDTLISGGGVVNSGNPGQSGTTPINLKLTGAAVAVRCEIKGGEGGNSVYMTDTSLLENSIVTGFKRFTNASDDQNSHVIRLDGSAKLVNCSIVANTNVLDNTHPPRGAVFVNSANARVVGCVIYGNKPKTVDFDSTFYEWGDKNGACYSYCAFGTGLAPAAGTACVATTTDASFRKFASGDFYPARGGAIFNAGPTWEEYLETGATSATDLRGKSRKVGDRLDIGCFELHDPGTVIFFK